MSSLGQLVAGVAHEINNPVNFIYGNLSYADEYIQDLLAIVQCYQRCYPDPLPEVKAQIAAKDLDFMMDDLPKILDSMKVGTDRIRQIVLSLRRFSRVDEAQMKAVDIHEGIDSTLMILEHRLKVQPDRSKIEVIKEYGNLPLVECYPGQLNQVFMNILCNAIDAVEELMLAPSQSLAPAKTMENPAISIRTEVVECDRVVIHITDNGSGIPAQVQQRIFDPFFTTKPVGVGTGMGLAISYQIVTERHGGSLTCVSQPGVGTEFAIAIPLYQVQA
jgi:two-component system, NtrC family, sensor kinase